MPETQKHFLKADLLLIAGQLDVTTEYLQQVAPDVKAPEMLLSAVLGVVASAIIESDCKGSVEPLQTLMRHCADYARVRITPDGSTVGEAAKQMMDRIKKDEAHRNN